MSQYQESSKVCKECQTGHMQRQFITYFTWLGKEPIMVPDFPAWVCDVCGRREYDIRALGRLSLILNPDAGKSARKGAEISKNRDNQKVRPSQIE